MLHERLDSRTITRDERGSTVVRKYEVQATDPEQLLHTGIDIPYHGQQHPTIPYLFVDTIELEPASDGRSTIMLVTYREPDHGSLTIYDEEWTWSISTEVRNVDSVIDPSKQLHYPVHASVGSVIGFDGEQVEGVDVLRPSTTLVVKKNYSFIGPYQREIIQASMAKVNFDMWFGYFPGQVLFIGADIRQVRTSMWEVTYQFNIKHYVGLQYVQLYTGELVWINPYPHDYIWFRYSDIDSGTSVQRGIKSVHMARVYDPADLHVLGLVGPSYWSI